MSGRRKRRGGRESSRVVGLLRVTSSATTSSDLEGEIVLAETRREREPMFLQLQEKRKSRNEHDPHPLTTLLPPSPLLIVTRAATEADEEEHVEGR